MPYAARRPRHSPITMPAQPLNAFLVPVLLLLGSNIFMTFAWYGHLSYKSTAIWLAILASWMIALPEYMLAVPANRIGSAVYSAAELKTMQEVITLAVFAVFSVTYLGESFKWNHLAAFGCLVLAAYFSFNKWD